MKYAPEFGRGVVALLLAGALWLVVSAEETTASWVPVRVDLTLDKSVELLEPPPRVEAFVVGKRRDLFKLISSPPTLRRAVTEDDRDSVRIELRAIDLDMPAGAAIAVRDLRPRLLTFRLRRSGEDTLTKNLLRVPPIVDTDVVIEPDTVLDSLARAKIAADSVARVKLASDSVAAALLRSDTLRGRKPPF